MYVRSVIVTMMNKMMYAAVILIVLIYMQVIAEKSERYWEEVGPKMDHTMNPNKYN
jgi:hypothetical protein